MSEKTVFMQMAEAQDELRQARNAHDCSTLGGRQRIDDAIAKVRRITQHMDFAKAESAKVIQGPEIVVMQSATRYPDGTIVINQLPFNEYPEWLKDKVNPTWNHSTDCECIICWNTYELGHVMP